MYNRIRIIDTLLKMHKINDVNRGEYSTLQCNVII